MRPQCLLLTTVAGSLAQSLHGGMKGVSLLLIEEFQISKKGWLVSDDQSKGHVRQQQ
jgi:hypothetical protein